MADKPSGSGFLSQWDRPYTCELTPLVFSFKTQEEERAPPSWRDPEVFLESVGAPYPSSPLCYQLSDTKLNIF